MESKNTFMLSNEHVLDKQTDHYLSKIEMYLQ